MDGVQGDCEQSYSQAHKDLCGEGGFAGYVESEVLYCDFAEDEFGGATTCKPDWAGNPTLPDAALEVNNGIDDNCNGNPNGDHLVGNSNGVGQGGDRCDDDAALDENPLGAGLIDEINEGDTVEY
jgi:hypothetical protein